jgi:Na+-driven multidrug efflux pump
LAKALQTSYPDFKKMLLSYTTITTLALFPFIVILYIFSGFFLHLLGGDSFETNLALQRNILAIICIYIMVLPIDRYSGVALFALNEPKLNFYKILFMLLTNVIFDLIAIIVFKSLVFVALATLIFTILGVVLGWFFIVKIEKATLVKHNFS